MYENGAFYSMIKTLFLICVFLALALIFFVLRCNRLENYVIALEAEKNGFQMELKRREEVIKNVQEREKIVEKLVYKDKEVFDWNADINNTAVVGELRKQCKSCSIAKH